MSRNEIETGLSKLPGEKGILYGIGILAGIVGLFKVIGKKKPVGKAVVILGSGRSGTSVLARSINIIGVDLGEEFIDTDETNPKGFFENRKIVNTHKEIGPRMKKRPYPEGFQHFEEIKPFRNQLENYIRDEFLDKPVWGWKDPRNNENLPMWRDILTKLNVEGNYLIIVRNPVDVVASYKRAYNRDETWARLQWQLRTVLALKETQGERRTIVKYEDLFGKSLACMRRIAKTFDLPWSKDESKIKNELNEFIDPTLQHSNSKTDIEMFKKRDDVEQDIKELYLLCLEGARSPKYLRSKSFNARVEKLYQSYLRDHGKLLNVPPKTS